MRSGAGLAQQVGDVKLDSSLADEKRFADFGNALARKNAIQHLGFSLGQPIAGAVIRGGERGCYLCCGERGCRLRGGERGYYLRCGRIRCGGTKGKTQGTAVKNNDEAPDNG